MTSYRIVHRTTYTYDAEVTGSYGQFHLRPRDLPWQSCLAHEIDIDPEPADLFRHVDLYGNTKSYFHVVRPHTRLVVTAISVVEVDRHDLDPAALDQPWEQARPSVRAEVEDAWEATDFTFASPYVEIPAGIRDYARVSFPAGRPIGEAAIDLMHRVHADFTYKSGSTTVSTKVGDLLRNRTGVCQDFSHFMVSGAAVTGPGRRATSAATWPPGRRPAGPGWSAPTRGTPGSPAGCRAPGGSTSTRPTTG